MKNLILVLIFSIVGTAAFATDGDDFKGKISMTQTEEIGTTTVDLNFASLDSFVNFDTAQLNFFEEDCTVDITVEVTIGLATVTLTAKDIPCDQIAATTKKLLQQAREAIR